MEPDELRISTRSARPDDSYCHAAVAAATASPGARGYLVIGSVLYSGRSSRSPLLSAERSAAKVTAPDRDGLLSDGRVGVRLGIGGISLHQKPRAAIPCIEFFAASGHHHALRPAYLFGYCLLREHGERAGDRRSQFALPASQREVRDIARLRLAGDGVFDPSGGVSEGGVLESVLRLHDRGAQFSTPSGAQQHGQAGDRNRLYDLGVE